MKILAVVALGAVLAHLSPVATAVLLCVADEAEADCCGTSGVDEATQLTDGSECGCCITVDAAPSTAGATSEKVSLDVLSASGHFRNAISSTGARASRGGRGHDPGDSRLASLRTIVLLI